MIKIVKGSIFDSSLQTITNPINCVGVMGKGLALQFKKQYPEMYQDYTSRCKNKEVVVGEPYVFKYNLNHKNILLFPTKKHWIENSRIEYITSGLDYFLKRYKKWGITSIAFPALGCGNGGLYWYDVESIMTSYLDKIDIPVEIYEP